MKALSILKKDIVRNARRAKKKNKKNGWNGLARNKKPRSITPKTRKRNGEWKKICIERAMYLKEKYGEIICEYSGETITVLSSVPHTFEEGWGHHIDSNRNNCVLKTYIFANLSIIK